MERWPISVKPAILPGLIDTWLMFAFFQDTEGTFRPERYSSSFQSIKSPVLLTITE